MSDEMKTTFTPEQIAQQAQGNAIASFLVSISYLRDHDLAVDQYVAYVGRRVAPGWEALRDRPIQDVAKMAALNMVSLGGELQSLSGDDSKAEAVIRGWPPEDWRTFFALDLADVDSLWSAFEPVAEHLGLRYSWKRQGDEVTMIFSSREND